MRTAMLKTKSIKRGEDLLRTLKDVSGSQGRTITVDGQEVLNFCSNNYLGLADDPRLVKAAQQCMEKEGFGSGASRLVCGNMSSHRKLEQRLAEFKKTRACLVFSSGYMANVGIISSVMSPGDIIFSDRLNHASIVDGLLLSRAEFRRYNHKDMNHLEEWLKKTDTGKKKLIVTDTVFSMDGDVAPVEDIVRLAKRYGAMTMVDEAHALGVFGKRGQGLVEHLGLKDDIDIQMGTLSKAVGSFGAYCFGSQELIDFLINHARSFIYTTGLPPSVCAASLCAIDIIENDQERRKQLWQNTNDLRRKLQEAGFDTMESASPIIPILIGENQKALDFSARLFENGIFVSAIRPPTVSHGTARLRVTVMATHTKKEIDQLVESFTTIGKDLCLI